jgi:genome maintenance exonuclease 1
MNFKHIENSKLNFDLKTSEIASQRFYISPNGKRYPSVTTILKEFNKDAIQKWRDRVGEEEANRVSRMASTRGNKIHSLCEKYILNNPVDITSESSLIRASFHGMMKVLDKNLGSVVCLEQALYSDKLMAAGRVDCIGEWNGNLAVIDFKTSSKEKREEWITNYFMQCTTYACMFYELTGIPIYDIVVLITIDGNSNPQIFHKKVGDYLTETLKFIKRYHENMETMV